jgi:hypothetical protein
MKPNDIKPLAAIPHKEGTVLVGVRRDGSEATLTVYVDQDSGDFLLPDMKDLIGWRWP